WLPSPVQEGSLSHKPADEVSVRQRLLKLLEADPPHEERLLAEFERQQRDGSPLYACLLSILTHLNFTEAEAYRHWRRAPAHPDRLRAPLAPDGALRAALPHHFWQADP